MKGHYLMLVFDDSREYVPLLSEDETIAEATERWVLAHPDMVNRQRNREKTAEALRASIVSRRLALPTSYWKRKAEEAGLPFPVPVGNGGKRRRHRG